PCSAPSGGPSCLPRRARRPARCGGSALLPVDGPLELGLAHLRATLYPELPRLVVELVARPAAGAGPTRALAAAPSRRDVLGRRPRRLSRLAPARALLLHGASGYLLGPLLGATLPALALLDALVLARALGALLDSARWHFQLLSLAYLANARFGTGAISLRLAVRKRVPCCSMTRGRAGVLVTCLALLVPVALPSTASAVAVKRGPHYGSRIFPDDAFTVRDSRQVTGRRVNFRKGLDYPTVK